MLAVGKEQKAQREEKLGSARSQQGVWHDSTAWRLDVRKKYAKSFFALDSKVLLGYYKALVFYNLGTRESTEKKGSFGRIDLSPKK